MAKGRKEDFNFRELLGPVLIVNNSNIEVLKKIFPNEMFDNAILAWGYIDHTAGLTFEVLCLGEYSSRGTCDFREGNPETSMKMRYDSVDGIIILLQENAVSKFRDRVQMIEDGYSAPDAAMKARNSEQLDAFRHQAFPDDYMVMFIKEGLKTEGIWCRVEKEIDGLPAGMLLESPFNEEFGLKGGDIVPFTWENVNGKNVAFAVLPWMKEQN